MFCIFAPEHLLLVLNIFGSDYLKYTKEITDSLANNYFMSLWVGEVRRASFDLEVGILVEICFLISDSGLRHRAKTFDKCVMMLVWRIKIL